MDGVLLMQDTLARDLLLCPRCSQYYQEPRLLPACQHSFCTQCLLNYYEQCRVELGVSQLRTLVCPQCNKASVLPPNGIVGLPEDQRAAKIKDLIELTTAERLLRQRFQELTKTVEDDEQSSYGKGSTNGMDKNSDNNSSTAHKADNCDMHKNEHLKQNINVQTTANEKTLQDDEGEIKRGLVNGQQCETNDLYQQVNVVVEDDHNIHSGTPSPINSSHNFDGNELSDEVEEHSLSDKKSTELTNCDIHLQSCRSTLRWHIEMHDHSVPSSAAFLENGGLVVAEYGNSALMYYNETGILACKADNIKPFSVMVDKDGYVVVGDRKEKTVKIFDLQGEMLSRFDKNTFKWIGGICQNLAGEYIIMDRSTYKISAYTTNGVLLRSFGSSPSLLSTSKVSRNDQFCMADFLAIDSHDRIIVCDSGSHCLRVFDQQGKFLMKFGDRGSGNGAVEWPKGLCVDYADNILVVDERNKRVSKFSSSGQFIEHIMECSHPYNIAFKAPNSLVLTQCSLSGVSRVTCFDYVM